MEKIAVDPREAAKMLGVATSTVYGWMADGKLVGRKQGRRTFLRVSDLHTFIDQMPVAEISRYERKGTR